MLDTLRAEAAAMDELTASCPVPTPQVVAIGEPGEGYPLPWSVQTWLPGETATPEGLAGSPQFAGDLTGLVLALRGADTRGRRFDSGGRGGLLADHDFWVERCFAESEGLVDVAGARALWRSVRDLPAPSTLTMNHRDLIPANLLVEGERLLGVLDGGGFAPADPALDLVAGWHLLDAAARDVFRSGVGGDDAEWRRGAGWALEQAMGLVWYYRESNPAASALGLSTVRRLLEAPEL
ncbi:putative phosphotransferase [Frondihabitans sucicola]|uniref:Phosphotransferase n=1 Tax=Frondihabitans sucicola TaxID=1268041 RepID=A0ABN6Y3X5_9MICO|nr:phosphotransferase [Frondihabitans sucicola]BDZ50580.1 putative phosphotransferase [Frondihabitans sucicola]